MHLLLNKTTYQNDVDAATPNGCATKASPEVDEKADSGMIYNVSQRPPIVMAIFFGLQVPDKKTWSLCLFLNHIML